ncbi:MAG: hypothetical protein WCJ47_09095, partial [Methanomicrobiales archaeon]
YYICTSGIYESCFYTRVLWRGWHLMRLFTTLFFYFAVKTLRHQRQGISQYDIAMIQVNSGTAALK